MLDRAAKRGSDPLGNGGRALRAAGFNAQQGHSDSPCGFLLSLTRDLLKGGLEQKKSICILFLSFLCCNSVLSFVPEIRSSALATSLGTCLC